MPSPTDGRVEDIVFLGCPSLNVCFRTCVLVARYLTNLWMEFHQTLSDDVVEVQMNCLGLKVEGSRSRSQQGQTFE